MTFTAELSETCRSLSKTGTLLFSEAYLRQLSTTLTASDAVELYSLFRDESKRYESEWRGEFLDLFPQSSGMLPDVDEVEFWQDQLFTLIRDGDFSGIQRFVDRIGTAEQQFDPRQTYSECSSMGYRDDLPHVPFDFYPIEGGDEFGTTAQGLARELGHNEIASFLDGIVAELDQRYFEAYREGRAAASTMP
jgi:hypothetical protein